MDDEIFSLGDSFENDEFSLGDLSIEDDKNGDFSLGEQRIDEHKYNETDLSDLQKVYDKLQIKDKDPRLSWEDFFKRNAGIFVLLGKKDFQIPTDSEINNFKKKMEQWINSAHKNWIDAENQHKTENLTEALQEVLNIYKKLSGSPDYAKYYIKEIKKNLSSQLSSVLKQKVKDGILELSEVLELYDIAVSDCLISDSARGMKSVLDWIKKKQENLGFKIESFQETFVRNTKHKSSFERFDTDLCKRNLFNEYKILFELSERVNDISASKTDSELYDEMYKLLVQGNLFVDNVRLYDNDFFSKEKNSGKYNFALPLNDEYFYYLKGTAIHTYQFSDSQWNDFIRIQNIKKDDDAPVAFIMGTEKASTIAGIANLIEDNPNMALSRIRAGDLETYLRHIGQIGLAETLSSKREELKNDTDILVQTTVALLRGVDFSKQNEGKEEKSTDSLLPLIEAGVSPSEIVAYLLRRKQFESLNKRILSPDSKEHKELEHYLLQNGFSLQKICMNYLHQFSDENNAQAYKRMYEVYAKYVLDFLFNKNDFVTFINVLEPVLVEGKNSEVLSEKFLTDYEEKKFSMSRKFDEYKNSFLENQNIKPKKSIFKFLNK
ncbi:MAG: hypothetical protein Q4P16_06760 [Spirochaetales bacterium]|nr:hypothetical protein [Spirochaetales bacterium]